MENKWKVIFWFLALALVSVAVLFLFTFLPAAAVPLAVFAGLSLWLKATVIASCLAMVGLQGGVYWWQLSKQKNKSKKIVDSSEASNAERVNNSFSTPSRKQQDLDAQVPGEQLQTPGPYDGQFTGSPGVAALEKMLAGIREIRGRLPAVIDIVAPPDHASVSPRAVEGASARPSAPEGDIAANRPAVEQNTSDPQPQANSPRRNLGPRFFAEVPSSAVLTTPPSGKRHTPPPEEVNSGVRGLGTPESSHSSAGTEETSLSQQARKLDDANARTLAALLSQAQAKATPAPQVEAPRRPAAMQTRGWRFN